MAERARGLTGTSISSTFLINGNVLVGNGTDATSSLKLPPPAAGVNGTLSGANLTFNLNSAVAGQANELDLGATNVTFGSTTLTLNVVGADIIGARTSFTLITDSAGFNATTDGLTISTRTINGVSYNVITGGLSIANSTFFGTPVSGITTGFYNGSFLYLSGDNIDVEGRSGARHLGAHARRPRPSCLLAAPQEQRDGGSGAVNRRSRRRSLIPGRRGAALRPVVMASVPHASGPIDRRPPSVTRLGRGEE